MARLLLAAVVALAVAGVALVLRRRRRPDVPTQPGYRPPTQLDRGDFAQPEAPWLVTVFSAASCHVCADVVRKAYVLACDEVAVVESEFTVDTALHRRYGIEAVPTVVVADRVGVVRASFMGPVSATDLWAAVAEARDPGTSPEPDLGRTPPPPPA